MAKVSASITIPLKVENQGCAQCGMLVEPANAFHPYLYCVLFSRGILNPAAFLEGQRFIPEKMHWGEDAPMRRREAARSRKVAANAGVTR